MKKKELKKLIRKKTGCTKEQASYLAKEMKAYPKQLDNFINHLDEIGLYNFKSVKVICVSSYGDSINIDARKVYDRFELCGKAYELEKMYLYHLWDTKCTVDIW